MGKNYTKEFKKQAVELAVSLGNISSAARQLGIRDSVIHSWKKEQFKEKYKNEGINALSESEIELQKLRKENAELKKVNHILRAAAAFFSQDHLK